MVLIVIYGPWLITSIKLKVKIYRDINDFIHQLKIPMVEI